MSSVMDTAFSLGPYHLLAYGTLLGTELWQSQVMTKIPYRQLPPAQFQKLQSHVFPAYFTAQTLLVLLTAATYPPYSMASLFTSGHIWTAAVPLGINLVMAGLNLFVYGPRSIHTMFKRSEQQAADAGKYPTGEFSEEMKKAKKDFSRNHAMSIHLNAIAMLSTVWYGFGLAMRIKFL